MSNFLKLIFYIAMTQAGTSSLYPCEHELWIHSLCIHVNRNFLIIFYFLSLQKQSLWFCGCYRFVLMLDQPSSKSLTTPGWKWAHQQRLQLPLPLLHSPRRRTARLTRREQLSLRLTAHLCRLAQRHSLSVLLVQPLVFPRPPQVSVVMKVWMALRVVHELRLKQYSHGYLSLVAAGILEFSHQETNN